MATVRTVRTQGGRARSSSVSETYIHPLMLPARFHKHAELQATFCVQIFQNTNLVHNSFILQQYICYTTLLNMFRAARCSSSGGQIVSPQPLVSSLFTNSRTVCRWWADSVRSPPAYCTAAYSQAQRKLPEDGPGWSKHVGANIRYR